MWLKECLNSLRNASADPLRHCPPAGAKSQVVPWLAVEADMTYFKIRVKFDGQIPEKILRLLILMFLNSYQFSENNRFYYLYDEYV